MVAKVGEPLIVIVGPTASGKSSLALKVAKKFNGEIVSADSWSIRRGLDIGTAKPTQDERSIVKHHLVDIVPPNEGFSAAEFKKLANEAIEEILRRKKLPLLAGGSGLYINGVIYDYQFIQANPSERAYFNSKSRAELLNIAAKQELDLAGVDINNKRRLIRHIENNGKSPAKSALRPDTLIIGIKPTNAQIKESIIKRIYEMLASGLEQEVSQLQDKYEWGSEALKGINYSQWQKYFEGEDNLEQTKLKLVKANYELAKKQMTWFKRDNSIHWFTTPVNWKDIVEIISTFLSNYSGY
jgi:tRNA dimethylallyltransferase